MLAKYRDLLLAHSDDMTKLLCQETGKPVRLSLPLFAMVQTGPTDVRSTVRNNLPSLRPRVSPHSSTTTSSWRCRKSARRMTTRSYLRDTPLSGWSVGPTRPKCCECADCSPGAICPWNFPIILSMGKVIPALLTGCTIIAKPSPYTPYTTLKTIELAQDIFPPGVVQVLGGDDQLGPMLTAHPGIAKISFTGSIATGKKIMAACAPTLKRCTLELGGNDAAIVLPDVDVAKTAPELVMGAFQNSGQVCVATKRIYIHRDIYDEMLREMVTFTKSMRVGAPGSGAMLGPIQNEMQYAKVKDFFHDTKSKGYKFAVGEPDVAPSDGFYIQPTIIDNPPNDSRIIQEEPFGALHLRVPCASSPR